MVSLSFAGTLLLAFVSSVPQDAAKSAEDAARPALRKENFPWYDPSGDAPKPMWPAEESRKDTPSQAESASPSKDNGAGASITSTLVSGLMIVVIAAAVAAILWAFYRFAPLPDLNTGKARAVESRKARLEALPVGLPDAFDDPWSEAVRLRKAGRLAEAILFVYLYELIQLRDRNLIRFAPGKTGRQLVRSIPDNWLRSRVEPALRLFESSYYGHHDPSPGDFDFAWSEAEAFRGRLAEKGVS